MSTPGKFRVKDIIFEEVQADGSIVERSLAEYDYELGYIRFAYSPEFPDQKFWIASDHEGLMHGDRVIASPVPNQSFDPEEAVNRSNTLIGMIRDGTCEVFASYTLPELGFVKNK